MNDTFLKQILQPLNNLLTDLNNFILSESCSAIQRWHIFVDQIQKTTFRTEFSDNITMSFAFVNVVTFDYIWMIDQFQNLYFVLEKLKTGRCCKVQGHHFYSVDLSRFGQISVLWWISLVDWACESFADLLTFKVIISTNFFLDFCSTYRMQVGRTFYMKGGPGGKWWEVMTRKIQLIISWEAEKFFHFLIIFLSCIVLTLFTQITVLFYSLYQFHWFYTFDYNKTRD